MVPILCSDKKKKVGKISFVVTKRTKKKKNVLINIQHVKANTAPKLNKEGFI